MNALKADLLLAGVAILWGGTFVMAKASLADIAPISLVAGRFIVAAIVMWAIFRKSIRETSRAEWIASICVGVFLGLGYTFQTHGLQTVSSAKTGFITGLQVVFVPVLAWLVLKHRVRASAWLGVFVSLFGLGVLTLGEDWTVGQGEVWVLGCALMFAAQILAIYYFVDLKGLRTIPLAFGQILTTALLATLLVPAFEEVRFSYEWSTWGSVVFLGLFATALAFLIQTTAQKYTSPVHVVLILTLEPVFAGIFGWWLEGLPLSSKEIWGSALILLGMVTVEIDLVAQLKKILRVKQRIRSKSISAV